MLTAWSSMALLSAWTVLGTIIYDNPFTVARKNPLHPLLHSSASLPKRQTASSNSTAGFQFLTEKTQAFSVDGTNVPLVDFDIGESYAGLLPVSADPDETKKFFFWFFPSTNVNATKEVTIWLNGGPGCSSLVGLIQENGPFLWQPGTYLPIKNAYSWTNLTNMLYIEQPVGTGYTQGTPNITSTDEAGELFLGFYKNFVDTFDLHGLTTYISGESYAGVYIPIYADQMISANDPTYFNVKGVLLYDPLIADIPLQEYVPATAYLTHFNNFIGLNQTLINYLNTLSDACNFTLYLENYLQFPPTSGHFPAVAAIDDYCFTWNYVDLYIYLSNPCFNFYNIAQTCPLPFDPLGNPGDTSYIPSGSTVYFDRADVKEALHVPANATWQECGGEIYINFTDHSPPTIWSVLPRVIEALNNTIISSGRLDFLIPTNGTLMAIQNMTWGGAQGLSRHPSTYESIFIPYHTDLSLGNQGSSLFAGISNTERGLTFNELFRAGHMGPEYAPSASFRQLEFLLGRVKNLTEFPPVPFTTDDDPADQVIAYWGP